MFYTYKHDKFITVRYNYIVDVKKKANIDLFCK